MFINVIYLLLVLLYGAAFLYWFTGTSTLSSKAAGCLLYLLIGWIWSLTGVWKIVWGGHAFYYRLDFSLFHFFFLTVWLLITITRWYRVRWLILPLLVVLALPVLLWWDHHLMPFFLHVHRLLKFPLIPLSLSLMLARALFHLHAGTHERLRLRFMGSIYCRYLDRCISSESRLEKPLAHLTCLLKTAANFRLAPPGLREPVHLYRRCLTYLERRLERQLVDFYIRNDRPTRLYKAHRKLIDTCIALALYYKVLGHYDCITGQKEPKLPQMAYLDLALFFSQTTAKQHRKKKLISEFKQLLDAVDGDAETLSIEPPGVGVRMPRDEREWLTAYRKLLQRLLRLRQMTGGETKTRTYLALKREVDYFFEHVVLPGSPWLFSAAREAGEAPPGLLYFLSSWAGFLLEYHRDIDPGYMRSLLAPAANFRGGAHALHLQLLLTGYSDRAAVRFEASSGQLYRPGDALVDYLDTQRAIHAYLGRVYSRTLHTGK